MRKLALPLNIFLSLIFIFTTGCFPKAAQIRTGIGEIAAPLDTLEEPESDESPYFETSRAYIEDLDSEVVEVLHKKSGAKLVLVKNKDQSRAFQIAFKTPPYDNTGLFHIFEHAVLAGSRLYPSKSNFFNVKDSSMASLLNAFTGQVNTFYPFVTRSAKEFGLLLPVYMDGVFFPNAVKNPNIMKREGWRFEVDAESKEMDVNGIVLNEMRGVSNSPIQLAYKALQKTLLPDTPFAFNSGGDPSEVMRLKFEQIVDAHKTYYHPQNSLIYLYGDLDFEATLKVIDEQFLANFTKDPNFVPPSIQKQKGFSVSDTVIEVGYPASQGDGKDVLVKGYGVNSELNEVEIQLGSLWMYNFLNSDRNGLQKELRETGLAQAVLSGSLGQDEAMAFFFQGTTVDSKEAIDKILEKHISRVINEGMDAEELQSIASIIKFKDLSKKVNGTQRGNGLAGEIMNHWLYRSETPLRKMLDPSALDEALRSSLADQQKIKAYFMKHFKGNKSIQWIAAVPDAQFSAKRQQAIDSVIEKALAEKPIEKHEEDFLKYKAWSEASESKDILDKTPRLDLKDLEIAETPEPMMISKIGDADLLEYPQPTSGMSFIELRFDLEGVSEEKLKYLRFFELLLGSTDLDSMGYAEWVQKSRTYIGDISTKIQFVRPADRLEDFEAQMVLKFSFLDENRAMVFDMVKALMTESNFGPVDYAGTLLDAFKNGKTSDVSADDASSFATALALQPFYGLYGRVKSEISGIEASRRLRSMEIDPVAIRAEMPSLLKAIFNQSRLRLVSSTALEKSLVSTKESLVQLVESLPKESPKPKAWALEGQEAFDVVAIPGDANYVVKAMEYDKGELPYSAAMSVYGNYLNALYMHKTFREKGGAYGAWGYFTGFGQFILSTYRDPSVLQSFQAMEKFTQPLNSGPVDEEALEGAKLRALSTYYSEKNITKKVGLQTALFLQGRDWASYLERKRQIVNTSADDILKLNSTLDQAIVTAKDSVAGSLKKIKKEAPQLNKVLSFE